MRDAPVFRWRATLADVSVVEAFDVEVYPASGILALWTSGPRLPSYEDEGPKTWGVVAIRSEREPDVIYAPGEWRKVEKL